MGCPAATGPDDNGSSSAAEWPPQTWPEPSPEPQGFDSVRLTDTLRKAADTGGLRSLFVARSGRAVVDPCTCPYDESPDHGLASVTKGVLALLVDIAAYWYARRLLEGSNGSVTTEEVNVGVDWAEARRRVRHHHRRFH